MFGTASGASIEADILLCVDRDLDNEFLFTVMPKTGEAFGILATADNLDADTITLQPRGLLKQQPNGGLYYPILTDSDKSLLQNSEIVLNKIERHKMDGVWKTPYDQGTITLSELPETKGMRVETLPDWESFKVWIADSKDSLNLSIFRGHGDSRFSLSTTLHRSKRNRLDRYCSETFVKFHGEAEAELGVRLDTNNPLDYAIVLGLAQHHGLPTPMLDWTRSPYIAAFFAFSDALDSTHRTEATHVRIFALTNEFVRKNSPQNVLLTWAHPFVSALAVSARHNARLRAQQGTFLVTNIANLGAWLGHQETINGDRFLYAVDLPISCASEALQDLAYMGLTAATMFPGLDGLCRALKHEMLFKTKPANL